MLVHHPDAAVDRVVGILDLDLFTVEENLAFIRIVQPVDDIHQGRFTGAVLTQKGVNFALFEAKRNVIVG